VKSKNGRIEQKQQTGQKSLNSVAVTLTTTGCGKTFRLPQDVVVSSIDFLFSAR
jgi:metal-sulfur cluster biosynthetic enzyme